MRSSADWSHGILPKDDSIQTAYKSIIENAQHFVYIENQFFITATGEEQKPVRNQIGKSIVNAIARAHNEDRKFRIIIVIPAIPGFPGDLREESALGTRAIIDYQYKSINRGEHSIYGQLEAQGIDATKYIFVFNLRTYDRLHVTEGLRKREKEACVSYNEAQADHAEQVAGTKRRPDIASHKPAILSGHDDSESSSEEEETADKRNMLEVGEGNAPAKDTVAEDAMAGAGHIAEEPWDDGEDREKMGFFQEELYVHAKVLIADDEIMVVGSSNINDRSQQGDHDSELSAVVEHGPTVSSMRKQLWMEHLGLLKPQPLDASDDPNAQPPGDSRNRLSADPLVEDPMSDKLWKVWTSQATANTKVYHDLFHVDPDNCSTLPPLPPPSPSPSLPTPLTAFQSKHGKAMTASVPSATKCRPATFGIRRSTRRSRCRMCLPRSGVISFGCRWISLKMRLWRSQDCHSTLSRRVSILEGVTLGWYDGWMGVWCLRCRG